MSMRHKHDVRDDGRPGVNVTTQYNRSTDCGNTVNSHNMQTVTNIENLFAANDHVMEDFGWSHAL